MDKSLEHDFVVKTFALKPAFCVVCNAYLWGLSDEGLICKHCELSVHGGCAHEVTWNCHVKKLSSNQIKNEQNVVIKQGKNKYTNYNLHPVINLITLSYV